MLGSILPLNQGKRDFLRASSKSLLESYGGGVKTGMSDEQRGEKGVLAQEQDSGLGCFIQLRYRGGQDTSIINPTPNKLDIILSAADIKGIFATGGKAYELYCRLLEPVTGIKAVKLPSTSPANAAFSEERLIKAYSAVLEYL